MPRKKETQATRVTIAEQKGISAPAKKQEPSEEEPCRLLSLAPELRNRIWEYALLSSEERTPIVPGLQQPSLLRTCRQIRSETLKLYYCNNAFEVEIHDCDARLWQNFIGHLDDIDVDPDAVDFLISTPGDPSWKNLLEWCRGVYDGTLRAMRPEAEDDNADVVIGGALQIALGAEDWPKALQMLESFRVVAGRINAQWLLD